jgi:Na+-transporting NADH:ubiquinone oxidoreductase subunit NqrC
MAYLAGVAKQRMDCDGSRLDLCCIGVRNGCKFWFADEIVLQYLINLRQDKNHE